MPRKAAQKPTSSRSFRETKETPKQEKKKDGFDFLRFGESYTSLILGIVVVIISTLLLLTFIQNRNSTNKDILSQNTQRADLTVTQSVTKAPTKAIAKVSPTTAIVKISPTKTLAKNPTVTPANEKKKVVVIKVTPTKAQPKTVAKAVITKEPTKQIVKTAPTKAVTAAKVTPVNSEAATKNQTGKQIVANSNGQKTYTIAAGDSLWTIAEKQYGSGYNWIDIARANNLSNPGVIYSGNKLVLPKVQKVIASAAPNTGRGVSSNDQYLPNNKITQNVYEVQKGDNLWDIAVRSYGDGYQWVKIAKANNLINPSIIFSGNKLKIPRS